MQMGEVNRRSRKEILGAPNFVWALGVFIVTFMLAAVMWIARDQIPALAWLGPILVGAFGRHMLFRGDERSSDGGVQNLGGEKRGRNSVLESPHVVWALGAFVAAFMIAGVIWMARDRFPGLVWLGPGSVGAFGAYLLIRGDQRITGRRIPR